MTGDAVGRGTRAGSEVAFWDAPAGPWPRTGSGPLALIRLAAYGLLTVALFPAQLLGLIAWPDLARAVPSLHHRLSAAILGLRIRREGTPARGTVLYVSNHVSYFDIIALGALVPASFVAKADVSSWPVFGLLAKLTRTVFVDRRAGSARRQVEDVRDRLRLGEGLIVFPEGTSSDGTRILPFKSTIFAAVEGTEIQVQPITISYTHLNGMPMERALRPIYAWYGDMDLAPHLWFALSFGSPEIRLRFHDPIPASSFADRKALARHCQSLVSDGLGRSRCPCSRLT